MTIPPIVSVDDHVIEPPNVWQDRLPTRVRDVAPRIVRAPVAEMGFRGGTFTAVPADPGAPGEPVDWWFYEDLRRPLTRLDAAVGYPREEVTLKGVTYEDMRPGAHSVAPRLEDMTIGGVEASMCFPTFPRFCGQTFLEATDRDLALLCVRAYNDWMVDEWCGTSGGRLIPLCLVPLWDPVLAAEEVRRNAARGVRAVAFTEIPAYLGLPSIHDEGNHWDPFFAACAETSTVVCMHIGSSSKMPSTSADAPPAVGSTLTFTNAMLSMSDFLFSGVLERFPDLTLAYAEGQIGWIPYILARADTVWEENRGWGGVADRVTRPPSEYYYRQIYGCFFDDPPGIELLERAGPDNVTYETDYPHSDSTWPDTPRIAKEQMGGLDDATIRKLVRGNAIRMLGLDLEP